MPGVVRRAWPSLVSVLALCVLWQAIGMLRLTSVLPSLTAIGASWVRMLHLGQITSGLSASLFELAVGFSASVVVGGAFGVLMGRYRAFDVMFSPYVNAFMVAPMSAFVPILALVFGIGSTPVIIAVYMFAVFILIVNVSSAIRSAPANLQEMARAFGGSEAQVLRRIVIPSALPLGLEGLRLSLSRAVKGMVIGEILIAYVGLGGRLETLGDGYNLRPFWALLLTIMALAVVLIGLLRLVQRWSAPWYFGAREQDGG